MTVFSYRQPSPRGEGAPKGRIGHWRYEREWERASQVRRLREHPIHRSASIYIKSDVRLRIILAPSSGRGRRAKRGGVGIPACEKPHREPTSAPSGHLLPKEGGSVPPSRIVISSESEKSFSFAVKKGCEERDHGKHRTPNDFIPYRELTSAPSGHLLPKEGGRKEACVDW